MTLFSRFHQTPSRLTFCLLYAAFFSQLNPVYGQAQGSAQGARKGTLLLSSNIACKVFLDGEETGVLAAGDVKKLSVELGDHLLVAKTTRVRLSERRLFR